MIWIAAAIVAAAGLGAWSERRRPERASALARRALSFVLYVLLPPIVFVNLAEIEFDFGLGVGLLLGVLTVALVGLSAWLIAGPVFGLPRPVVGAVVCCSVVANTGYLGYPLVLTLMGSDDLSQGVAWDAVVSDVALTLFAFGAGAAFGTTAGEGFRQRLKAFFLRNPVLYAAILGLLVPGSLIPDLLVEISWVMVALVLPIGFFAIGVVIEEEVRSRGSFWPPRPARAVGVVALARLVVAPSLLFLLSVPFTGIPPSFYLMAAMPAGINSMIVGHAYGLDLRTTAWSILTTTAIVVTGALVWTVLA